MPPEKRGIGRFVGRKNGTKHRAVHLKLGGKTKTWKQSLKNVSVVTVQSTSECMVPALNTNP